eukprot:1971360-Prymnesium_polylepis.1
MSTTPLSRMCTSRSESIKSDAQPLGGSHPFGTSSTDAGGGVLDDLASAQMVSCWLPTIALTSALRLTTKICGGCFSSAPL